MKAQVIKKFGDASVFEFLEIPKPTIKPGQVLIKVQATSVNPVDYKIRSGLFAVIAPQFPAILHGDVAGTVEAVAEDVKNFKVGDEVYGCAGGVSNTSGALAEYMLVDSRLIARKPTTLSFLEAAALPLVTITAWEALFQKLKLTSGQPILIHAGTGGVGHIAIQLAKWCGNQVYTTVRRADAVPIAKSLGADEVINTSEESVEQYVTRLTQGKGFNFIFDTVGGENLDRSLQAVSTNGHIVCIQGRSTHDLTPLYQKAASLHMVSMLLPMLTNSGRDEHGKILSKAAELVDQGELKPVIDPHRFNLPQISDAHTLLESGKARGKVVVSIN